MARHSHEFQCDGARPGREASPDGKPDSYGNCGWYNYPPLDDKMTGNFNIICGNPLCKHKHMRVIVKGVVTSDRHNESYGAAHVIHVLPSQCQPTKRQLGTIAQIRQMEAAGRMT